MSRTLSLKRWLPYLLIVLFIASKIPHLFYPFYWDESEVYAPSIYLMHLHGPSLLPGAITADFSRGHPMLYQALCATWMNIFGSTHFAMHSFALLISTLLAVTVYETSLKLFNGRVAIISLILLLLNLSFYYESSFVLTDIMISLWALLSLYFYTREKYFLVALSLALLFYTKESGLVIAPVLGGDILWRFLSKKASLKTTIYRSLSVAVPLCLIILFFILQKNILGWYLFPCHTHIIDLSTEYTLNNLYRTFLLLFYNDHAYYLFTVLPLIAAISAWKQKKSQYLWILYALLFLIAFFVCSVKDTVFIVFAALSAGLVIYFVIRKMALTYDNTQQRFLKLTILFCLLFTYFSCINFYECRYLFPVIILSSVVFLSLFYDYFISRSAKGSFAATIAILLCAGLYNLLGKNDESACYDRMDVQQQVVDYFEKNIPHDKQIYCVQYLERLHLSEPLSGFLHSDNVFNGALEHLDTATTLAVFDNIEPTESYIRFKKNNTDFNLIKLFKKGDAWAEVYQRKNSLPQ